MKFRKFEDVAKFHGHVCPGLALGYRVAIAAQKELNLGRSEDEEVVCISENDSCAVDAIQVITGCTIGKGNLIIRDYGKQVYTFFDRKSKKAIRISVDFEFKESDEDKNMWQNFMEGIRTPELIEYINKKKAEKVRQILNSRQEEILKITYPEFNPPREARIFRSIRCENCGEKVAEIKARILKSRKLCIPCFERLL